MNLKRIWTIAPAVALLASALLSSSAWAEPSNTVVYTVDRVYTAPAAPPIDNAVVVIRDGKIVSVGVKGAAPLPAGAVVHEPKGSTMLAGFWNSHVHFMGPGFEKMAVAPAGELTASLRRMLLQYGFVHAYQVAALDLQDSLALRQRIEKSEVIGPSIHTTGMPFVGPGGTPGYIQGIEFPKLTDVSTADKAARGQMAAGADGIKLMPVTGNFGHRVPMSVEVARAAVAAAHANNGLVFVHPTNVEGVRIAVQSGADVVVHVSPDDLEPWDDALVAEMKRRNVALIPTLKLYLWDPARQGASPEAVKRVSAMAVQQLALYSKSGGVVLFGTDVGYMSDYDPADEYSMMTKAGLTFEQLLASLTTAPALKFGVAKRTGEIKRGMDADIVILDGDPKRDVQAFTRVKLALLRGKVVFERD